MANLRYEELNDMLCDELNNVVKKGSLTKDTLDTTHKLTSSLSDLAAYKAMKEKNNSESSYRYSEGYRNDRMPYNYDYSFDGRRGRDADNDGRYSERGYYNYDGYSGHDMSTAERLENMLRDARSEQEKEQIRRWMREIKN